MNHLNEIEWNEFRETGRTQHTCLYKSSFVCSLKTTFVAWRSWQVGLPLLAQALNHSAPWSWQLSESRYHKIQLQRTVLGARAPSRSSTYRIDTRKEVWKGTVRSRTGVTAVEVNLNDEKCEEKKSVGVTVKARIEEGRRNKKYGQGMCTRLSIISKSVPSRHARGWTGELLRLLCSDPRNPSLRRWWPHRVRPSIPGRSPINWSRLTPPLKSGAR